MADIFNAFVRGQEIGTQQRLLREQQQREEKLNALSGQAFSAAPDQVNQLARTATELGGAQAGQNIQTIAQGQNELQRAQATRVYEEIARGIYDVSRLPEGPEREQAWSQRVGQIVKDPAQRDQLLSLGSAQGINTVVSQIAPVADLLKAYGVGVSGTDAGPRVLSPGAVLVDQQGNPLYRNPAIDRFSPYEGVDPTTGRPIPYLLGTTGQAAGRVIDPRANMGGAPASQPAPAPTGSASFVDGTGRPINIDMQGFGQLDPVSREGIIAELERTRGLSIPADQRAALVGSPSPTAPPAAPAAFGQSDTERAEAAALEARRVEEERRRGQAAVEAEVAAPAAEEARRMALESVQRTRQTVNDAISQIGPTSAGFVGARLREVEGTEAYNLARTLDTVQANLAFDTLAAMRAASPTGGALGAISERELNLLGSTVQSLDPNQEPAELRRKLAEIQYYYDRTIARIEGRDADSVPRPAGVSAPAAEIRSPSGVVIRPRNR